jgi:uncharacterized membrane protein YraQ (UPF0718 family)
MAVSVEKSIMKKRRALGMLIPTIIVGVLAIILLTIGYYRGQGDHILGMKLAFSLIVQVLPLLVFALIVAGMVQVIIPKEFLSKWVGEESGMRGILIGTVAGGFSPGGPYVNLPIAAGLIHAGASIGTMVAFLTGWSLLAFNRLPMEIGILGWRFTLIRLASTFFFPPIAGWIAHTFFRHIK